MAPPEPEPSAEETKKAANKTDDSSDSGKNISGSAASASRENFLRRLEQQQQQQQQPQEQQQLKSPPEVVVGGATKKPQEVPAKTESADGEGVETATTKTAAPAAAKNEERPTSTEKDTAPANSKGDEHGNGNEKNAATAPPSSSSDAAPPRQEDQKKQSVGDGLLLDYLSKYCEPASSGGEGAAASPPSDWIRDVDPSSLALLKGLAGIPLDNDANNVAAMNARGATATLGRMKSDSSVGGADATDGVPGGVFGASLAPERKTKAWEVLVPPDAVPGEPFALMAKGVRVRVVCPKNAKPGSKIRFHLPVNLFEKPPPPQPRQPSAQPPAMPPAAGPPANRNAGGGTRNNWWSGGMGTRGSFHVPLEDTKITSTQPSSEPAAGRPTEPRASSTSKPSTASKTSSDGPGNTNGSDTNMTSRENISLQHRMLNIIERQQSQMHEMQARLDALGGMMAQMEQDMRYLRGQRPQQQQGWGRQAPPQYRMLGGLFGGGYGRGAQARPGAGAQAGPGSWQPQQEAQQRGVLPEALERPQDDSLAAADTPGSSGQRGQRQQARQQQATTTSAAAAQREPAAQGAQPPPVHGAAPPPRHNEQVIIVNQGIFFPLFVMLFRFLLSLPRRLRSLLLSTGIGRVYAHLRQRAIDRNAFANVDLSSIMKLLVMLLIFSGRMGDRTNNNARNNNHRRNAANAARDDEEFGMVAYAHQLLQWAIDYWNGHRVHTLILASLIGFLIQVGLGSFLYQVLWTERAELLRVWLGQDEQRQEDLVAGEGDGGGADGEGGGVRGDQGADNGDGAVAPAPHPENPAATGGMIRRGPENGGILHDIQCLILSFLLSLIPAWRPEEAAQPAEEPQQAEEADQAPEAAAPDSDQGAQGEGEDEAAEE